MRLGVQAESFAEWVALKLGLVPEPLFESLVAMWLARTLMVAAKVGVFAALAPAPATSKDVAAACGLHEQATETLLQGLVGL